MKNKKLKKILLVILSTLLILLLSGFFLLTRVIPVDNFQSILALGGEVTESDIEKFQNKDRDNTDLPEIMTLNDGTKVETIADMEKRQSEILELFNEYVYGEIPKSGFETSFEIIEEGEYLDGAATRKQIEITVKTTKGETKALMALYIPNVDEKVPAVIGLNFKGNTVCFEDKEILPSYSHREVPNDLEETRGTRYERWPVDKVIEAGYALATIHCDDFAYDDKSSYQEGVISLFDDENFKTVSAWAFGLIRGVDYLVTDEAIDENKIISVGHSRLGKTSLWAGANDERISLVISNDSGSTGAALSRGNKGETVSAINTLFPHWFTDTYKNYNNNEEDLPVDQHMLLSLIAPRNVYIASADKDFWADPVNEFLSLKEASIAYEHYDLETIDFPNSIPKANTQLVSESMAYHIKDGVHSIDLTDWDYYLEYIKNYIE